MRPSTLSTVSFLVLLASRAGEAPAFVLTDGSWAYQPAPMGEDITICANPGPWQPMPLNAADRIRDGGASWDYDYLQLTFAPDHCPTSQPTSCSEPNWGPLGLNCVNQVYFAELGASGVLGTATWWTNTSGDIFECDVRINSQPPWHVGTGSPPQGQYDLWSVAAHELGHCIGLGHSERTNPLPVMYATLGDGTARRELRHDDVWGRNTLYGGCGDGNPDPGEECDDGNDNPLDGCSLVCTICGNGQVTGGEECDDGNANPNDGCTNACTPCGNQTVTAPEECDDGNFAGFDGCNASCNVDYCPESPVNDCDDSFLRGKLKIDDRRPGRETASIKLLKGTRLDGASEAEGSPYFLQDYYGNPLCDPEASLPIGSSCPGNGGTSYSLCLYDGQDQFVGSYTVARAGMAGCSKGACWQSLDAEPGQDRHHGYRFQNLEPESPDDGLVSLQLKAGGILARGDNLTGHLPTGIPSALLGSSRITVQLHASNAPKCRGMTLTDIQKSDVERFQAKERVSPGGP